MSRHIDDIADGDLAPADKLAELERARDVLGRLDASNDPVHVALADAAARYPIPLEAFSDLIDGAELDARGVSYETFVDLERYLPLRCRLDRQALARGVRLLRPRARRCSRRTTSESRSRSGTSSGTWPRDAANGRVYLPREDLARFGCEARDDGFEGPFELVVAFEAERGLGWLRHGLDLLPLLDRRSASCVAWQWRGSTSAFFSESRPSRNWFSAAACRCDPGRKGSCSPAASQEPEHESGRGRRRAGRALRRRSTAPTAAPT